VPLFVSVTPPGNEPLTVNAGVPVLVEEMTTPLEIVAMTNDDSFQPALTASVRRFALFWLLLIVNKKSGGGPPDPANAL
jgi:hypothetical protein